MVEVIWSDQAKRSFQKIIEYLSESFTDKEIDRFVRAVDKKIILIQANPKTYRKSVKYKNIHYTNILRRTLLIYRYKPRLNIVELIHFADGRQNPRKFRI